MAKILLVEDNEMNRDMLSRRLERKGYEVLMAVDGERRRRQSADRAPDLILMDMSLPGRRRLGGDAPAQGGTADAEDPDHRPHGARHAGRSREGAGSGLRRLRHQAGRAAPVAVQDPGAAGTTRLVSMDREALAHLRHELRTPLNHIIGYSEMLLEDMAAGDPAALGPGLRQVHEDAQRLLAAINELSHTDAGEVDLGRLSSELSGPLRSVMTAVDGVRLQAARAGAERAAQDLDRVATAAAALQSVITNGVAASSAQPATGMGANAPSATAGGALDAGVILVVDDNAANQEMLGRRLEREGHRCNCRRWA